LKPRPADLLRAPCHVVRVAEPDRPRGRRSGAPEAEQLVDRLPRQLALEVVEGVVDRSARRLLTRREAVGDLVEPKRIVAEIDRVEPVERRPRRLRVALDRRRLAEARHTVVLDLDLHDVSLVLRPAGDRERLRELHCRLAGCQIHGATLVAVTRP